MTTSSLKSCLLFLTVTTIIYNAFAQQPEEQILVSGNVIDKATNEPLCFATVSILGTTEGVISNFLGEFKFSFSKSYNKDTLIVSFVGYERYKVPVKEVKIGSNLRIELEPSVLMLEGIDITTKAMSAKDVIKKAIGRIPDNYQSSPFLLEFFTRSHKKECGEYKSLYEATFSMYARNLTKRGKKRVYLKETRFSKRPDYYQSDQLREARNLVQLLFAHDYDFPKLRSLQLAANNFELASYTTIEDRPVYIIKATRVRKPHYEHDVYHLYIDMETYAILKIDWRAIALPRTVVGPSSDSTMWRANEIEKTLQFILHEGKYYPKYGSVLINGKLYRKEGGEEFCDYEFYTEMIVDEINTGDVKTPTSERMNKGVPHEFQLMPYNASFWKNYKLVKDFPVNKQIVEDLSKRGVLESQYKNSFAEMEVFKKNLYEKQQQKKKRKVKN